MSKINGEKARSAIARKRRTAQRVKDRAALAAIKGAKPAEAAPAAPAPKKAAKAKAS